VATVYQQGFIFYAAMDTLFRGLHRLANAVTKIEIDLDNHEIFNTIGLKKDADALPLRLASWVISTRHRTQEKGSPPMSTHTNTKGKLFDAVKIAITPAAQTFLYDHKMQPAPYIDRHYAGDWSEMLPMDQWTNQAAVKTGGRIVSSFTVCGQQLFIITEADRSVTTILLSSEM
jgi:hypothetical protein